MEIDDVRKNFRGERWKRFEDLFIYFFITESG